MKKQTLVPALLVLISCITSSCRSCVKKAAEKTTELALSAVDGMAEALNERGEETGKKVTGALGKLAKGSLSRIEDLLDEYADTVAQAAGRTLVQTLEGLDKGIAENYIPVSFPAEFPAGVTLDRFGKINNKNVLDAWFAMTGEDGHEITLTHEDAAGNVLFDHTAKTVKSACEEGRYTVVSYALNPQEAERFNRTTNVATQKLHKLKQNTDDLG